MNKLIIVIAVCCSTFLFAQKEVTITDISTVKKDYFKIHLDDAPAIKHTFNFSVKKDNLSQLSVYNTFSQLNDVYFLQNGTYQRVSPRVNIEDNWIRNKTDSFNPAGAGDFGGAVAIGIINFLFQKL